jgi:protein-S-isoprenylcysteine O-methyltransferase Ste14
VSAGRGGSWVVAQFALMGAALVAIVVPPDWPSGARDALVVIGVVLLVLGVIVAVAAGRALGRAMTPFPRPIEGAELVETGPYRVVRHPVYTGGLLFFVGWSLIAGPVALALTLALAALWAGKIAVEERYLRATHPGYVDYARRVRRRLVPGVY